MDDNLLYPALFEDLFGCAGMCTNTPFFAFSNVNFGVATSTCIEKLYEYVDDYYVWFIAFAFTFAGLILLGLVASCMVCDFSDDNYDE